MKLSLKTILLVGLLGIFAAPAISMESKEGNSAQKSSALSLQGIMSRNLISGYSVSTEETVFSNRELNYQQSINPIPLAKEKTTQNNSLGLENTGEPPTKPFRISIFQL